MASLDHSGSRTILIMVRQSTLINMLRKFLHFVDGKRSSGSASTLHTSKESLELKKRFSDRLISRKCDSQWSPYSPNFSQIFISVDILRTGSMPPKYSWFENRNHNSNKNDSKGGFFLQDSSVLAVRRCSFLSHSKSTIFYSIALKFFSFSKHSMSLM